MKKVTIELFIKNERKSYIYIDRIAKEFNLEIGEQLDIEQEAIILRSIEFLSNIKV